jgi:hypothetical protein
VQTFPAATLRIQHVKVLIVFLDAAFDAQSVDHRRILYSVLQEDATRAGLADTVALVWQDGSGRTCFLAPPQQHPFFLITSYDQLYAQIDQTITVNGSLPRERGADPRGSAPG